MPLLITLRSKMLISYSSYIACKVVSSTVQIFYLQETEIVSSSTVKPSATIASLYLQNSTCLLLYHEFIITAGKIAGVTSQMQYAASTVMPMMFVERSTNAMILVGFLAEVGLYKYLSVPFPENFVSFCEEMD